jgi:CRISPR-associated protein Cas2
MKSTTLFVIAYDIPNDKRRTKVHKVLCGFGDWTQYSMFECFLDAKELVLLRSKLDHILNPSEDSVRIYPLCNSCLERVETIGGFAPEEKLTYIL